MSINQTLFDSICHQLYNYGCEENEIESFLFRRNDYLKRQNNAIEIIEKNMTMHGKQELLQYVAELARVEHGIQEIEPWVRDHVVHALLSFLLGININENFFPASGIKKVTHFQWKLTGLFHDIGYPIQIAKDIISPFTKKVNEIKTKLSIDTPDIQLQIIPIGLTNLQNNQNSLTLIQNCLNGWDLDIDAKKEYSSMITKSNICHGIMSSLTMLYVIDLMYQKFNPKREYKDTSDNTNINWNQLNFETEIVPACSAIFIHNLKPSSFNRTKINPAKAPLAYLLKLTDTLQEWERPSLKNINGYPSEEFDIEINKQNKLIFHVSNSEVRQKIQNEIYQTIINHNIIISN